MGTELTRRLISMRAEIEENGAMWGGTKDNLYKRIDDCIALSQQPPVYAMSRDYEALYEHLVKGGEAFGWKWEIIQHSNEPQRIATTLQPREEFDEISMVTYGSITLPSYLPDERAAFLAKCARLQLEWLAPSPQAVTVEGRWISVDERLPEMGEAVIVYPHPHICRYGPWEYYGVEQVAGFHSWDDRNDTDSLVPGVTHWMPIPSAPASTNT